MTTIPPNAQQVLNDNERSLGDIASNVLGPIPDGLSIDQQEEYRARQIAQMQLGEQQMKALRESNQDMKDATDKAVSTIPNSILNNSATASSFFDLLKEAQAPMPPMADPMGSPMEDQLAGEMNYSTMDQITEDGDGNNPVFDSQIKFSDFLQYLEEKAEKAKNGDPDSIDQIRKDFFPILGNEDIIDENGKILKNPQQVISDNWPEFLTEKNEKKRAELAMEMFEVMPQSNKGDTMVRGVEQVVADSNNTIRMLAKSLAEYQMKKVSSGKPFNLKKEAQHKTMENIVMHGPGGNRIDPFTGQLINDWHIYERNKGWGLKMDDALFVDYEAIWRGNIMDKYSRPYRDKDGNYVGGYIDKRFETDRWNPPGNNYQLKPGERRRPYLPEYGLTEARMQHMRSTNKDEGKVFNDTSKPFNWSKMAKSEKRTKTSQFNEMTEGQYVYIVQDLETGQELNRIEAINKEDAKTKAQEIAQRRSQPVSLLTYDFSVSDMDPIEDMIWPGHASQPVIASSDSKKKVN